MKFIYEQDVKGENLAIRKKKEEEERKARDLAEVT